MCFMTYQYLFFQPMKFSFHKAIYLSDSSKIDCHTFPFWPLGKKNHISLLFFQGFFRRLSLFVSSTMLKRILFVF